MAVFFVMTQTCGLHSGESLQKESSSSSKEPSRIEYEHFVARVPQHLSNDNKNKTEISTNSDTL